MVNYPLKNYILKLLIVPPFLKQKKAFDKFQVQSFFRNNLCVFVIYSLYVYTWLATLALVVIGLTPLPLNIGLGNGFSKS